MDNKVHKCELTGEGIFAPVKVGKLSGYALVDTGSRKSSIFAQFANDFPIISSRQRYSLTKMEDLAQVSIPTIKFLGSNFNNVILDIEKSYPWPDDYFIKPIVMVLGCDLLLSKPLYWSQKKYEFSYIETDRLNKMNIEKLNADYNLGIPFFQINFGNRKFDALFDTGCSLCLLNKRYFKEYRRDLKKSLPEYKRFLHIFWRKITTYSYKGFSVGKYQLKERRFKVVDFSNLEKVMNHRIDFVFGLNAIIMIWGDWILDKDGGYLGFKKVERIKEQ